MEVWNKGLIWDKALGHYWLPLNQIQYSNEVPLFCAVSLLPSMRQRSIMCFKHGE